MSDKTSAQIFVAMNEDGAFECATAADDAAKYLHENYGGEMCRIVVIDVMMSPPKLIDGGVVDVPDEVGETVETSTGDLPEASRSSHHSG